MSGGDIVARYEEMRARVDRVALDAAAVRLLESPQIVAVRIEDGLANTPVLERVRADFTGDLDRDTAGARLSRRAQPVMRNGESLGTLVLWFDADYGRGLLQARRDQMLVLVLLQTLAILAVLMMNQVLGNWLCIFFAPSANWKP